MEYTEYYNLKKPESTDPVLVGDLNDNADAIDTALEGKEDTSNKTQDIESNASSTDLYPSAKAVVDYAAGKVDAPAAAGTEGQVLGLDSNLHSVWLNAGGGSAAYVKDGTTLVIAEGNGKKLSDCYIGDVIQIKETRSGVSAYHDYIVVEKNSTSTVVLRKYLSDKKARQDQWLDEWLNGTYKTSTYSALVQGYMVDTQVKYVSYNQTTTVDRKVFSPSMYNMGDTSYDDGANVWFDTDDERKAAQEGTSTYAIYGLRTCCNKQQYTWGGVQTSGALTTALAFNQQYYVRPCISLSNDTPLNGNNQLEEGGVVYTNTVDKIQDGDNYYKIADQRIPSTSGLADGNYKLRVSIASGVPTFSWVADT